MKNVIQNKLSKFYTKILKRHLSKKFECNLYIQKVLL